MSAQPLPASFLLRENLTWRDVLWGIEQGWADRSFAVSLAIQQLQSDRHEDEDKLSLAAIIDTQDPLVLECIKNLAEKSPISPITAIRMKWLYLALKWLYANRNKDPDPFGRIEELYADFGYPEQIASFIRYMPVSSSYKPEEHSLAENYERLLNEWRKYLERMHAYFQ